MQTTSANYKTAIASTDRTIKGYLKFNGTFNLSGSGGLIDFKVTQNAMDAERFCVGSVTSAFCEANFYNSGLEGSGVSLANAYFDAYIGVVHPLTLIEEYVCCGRYYVSEISRGKETTRILGYDIAGRLSMDYVPTVTPDPDDGYLVMDILNDIIDQTGINGGTHYTTFGNNTYVSEIYKGDCRAQWGWLCTLVDKNAESQGATRVPAYLGNVVRHFAGNAIPTPYAVTEDTTYLDGVSFGDAYTITSFTSGTTENPIVIGNGTGMYGLNPYMTNAIATTIEHRMHNYTYYPATLHWRGDPALDILDEINVTQGGNTYKMVAMKIETTFNGGLEQTITCYGDSEDYYALSTSPTQGQINRVNELVNEMQQAIETADGGVITKILDTDGTWKELVIANNQDLDQATSVWRWNINGLQHSTRYSGGTVSVAMDTQGRFHANVIQTGTLQDANGDNSWNLDTGAFTITNGSINITTSSAVRDQIRLNWNDGNANNVETQVWSGGVSVTDHNSTYKRWFNMNRWGYYEYQDNANGTNSYAISQLANATLTLGSSATAAADGVGVVGDIWIRGNDGTNRTHINDAALTFYNSSGTLTASYPSDGDVVVEQGTVDGWTYRKFFTGRYECWKRYTHNVAVDTAWGSLYYGAIPRINYPVTFLSSPYEQVTVVGGSYYAFVGSNAGIATETQTGTYLLMRGTSQTAHDYKVEYYVRGRVAT